MKKRQLYKLETSDDAIIVYRTDNNYGRQGIVYKSNGQTKIRNEYSPYLIPNYIVKECEDLLTNLKPKQ